MSAVVVIGVGNRLRGDDAAGLLVAERIDHERALPGIAIRLHSGDGLGLIDLWEGARAAVVIDAVRTGAQPGTVHTLALSGEASTAPTALRSSHDFGVGEAIALGRVLGRLPDVLTLIGVECESLELGEQLSPAVAGAIGAARDAAVREAERHQGIHALS